MRIVVNHVTRMRTNERICVAGIAPQAREHLRPVTPRTDLITRALLRETGGPFGPGAIAELGPVTACPNRPESEDHWFSTANARHIGDLSDDEYIEILEQTADPTLHEAFGNALIEIRSRKFGVPAGEGTRSLAVVPVLGRPTLRIDDYGNLHLHLDNPDTAAKLRVTDVRFYESDHETVKTDIVTDVGRRLARGVPAHAMVGLARPMDDIHWLQLNGLCLHDRAVSDTP